MSKPFKYYKLKLFFPYWLSEMQELIEMCHIKWNNDIRGFIAAGRVTLGWPVTPKQRGKYLHGLTWMIRSTQGRQARHLPADSLWTSWQNLLSHTLWKQALWFLASPSRAFRWKEVQESVRRLYSLNPPQTIHKICKVTYNNLWVGIIFKNGYETWKD